MINQRLMWLFHSRLKLQLWIHTPLNLKLKTEKELLHSRGILELAAGFWRLKKKTMLWWSAEGGEKVSRYRSLYNWLPSCFGFEMATSLSGAGGTRLLPLKMLFKSWAHPARLLGGTPLWRLNWISFLQKPRRETQSPFCSFTIQFNFIYIVPVTIQMVSRRFMRTGLECPEWGLNHQATRAGEAW